MQTLTMTGSGRVDAMADLLTQKLEAGSAGCELVSRVSREYGPVQTVLLVFQKYYWRNNGQASLTLLFTGSGSGGTVTVDLIGSGGGVGLLGLSLGAESDFVEDVEELLSEQGFHIV